MFVEGLVDRNPQKWTLDVPSDYPLEESTDVRVVPSSLLPGLYYGSVDLDGKEMSIRRSSRQGPGPVGVGVL